MEPIADFFKEEDDCFFKRGYKKERERLQLLAVSNLITKFEFSDQKIADGMELPIEFVKSVRESLQR